MTLVQTLRERLASEHGIEMTLAETEAALVRAELTYTILTEIVRGRDWSWLRVTSTAELRLVARLRLERMFDTPMSGVTYERLRGIILRIDERVNRAGEGK